MLRDLGLDHVAVEPLRLSYRSTHEIIDFATEVLGPLRNEEEGHATRHGVPVDLFKFAHSGDAVGFLGEALRELVQSEPRASGAGITANATLTQVPQPNTRPEWRSSRRRYSVMPLP